MEEMEVGLWGRRRKVVVVDRALFWSLVTTVMLLEAKVCIYGSLYG
jgi:hypothetical protein